MQRKETAEKTRTQIVNELLSVITVSDGRDGRVSTDYIFICVVADRIYGTNRYADEVVTLLEPTLKKIETLREELDKAEHNLRVTLARLKKEWLHGEGWP